MNKEKIEKDIRTFLEMYKIFGEEVSISWLVKELTQKTK